MIFGNFFSKIANGKVVQSILKIFIDNIILYIYLTKTPHAYL